LIAIVYLCVKVVSSEGQAGQDECKQYRRTNYSDQIHCGCLHLAASFLSIEKNHDFASKVGRYGGMEYGELGSLAALVACSAANSVLQHKAELPWTWISGEFSSQFGQERSPGFQQAMLVTASLGENFDELSKNQ
jgi:hypothetical protein